MSGQYYYLIFRVVLFIGRLPRSASVSSLAALLYLALDEAMPRLWASNNQSMESQIFASRIPVHCSLTIKISNKYISIKKQEKNVF